MTTLLGRLCVLTRRLTRVSVEPIVVFIAHTAKYKRLVDGIADNFSSLPLKRVGVVVETTHLQVML